MSNKTPKNNKFHSKLISPIRNYVSHCLIVVILLVLNIWVWFDFNSFQKSSTTLTLVFTALAALATAWAAYATQRSSKIAELSIEQSAINNKKIAFENTFHLLLNQHNDKLKEIKEILLERIPYTEEEIQVEQIDKQEKAKEKLIYSPNDILSKNIGEACSFVRESERLSPYFIILFQILKFIDTKFYLGEAQYEIDYLEDFSEQNIKKLDPFYNEKKFYTSLIRSFINSDVLLLVAVNCMMIKPLGEKHKESTQYYLYRRLLRKYNFFEHLRVESLHISCMSNNWVTDFFISPKSYKEKINKLASFEQNTPVSKGMNTGLNQTTVIDSFQQELLEESKVKINSVDFFYNRVSASHGLGFIYYGYGSHKFHNSINHYTPYHIESSEQNELYDSFQSTWNSENTKLMVNNMFRVIQINVNKEYY